MTVLDFGGSALGLRTEISNELASVLAAVLDASGEDGGRYDARTRRTLVQTIAARAYGKPLLELAYLIAAADQLSGRHGYVGFFWSVRAASAGAYRAAAFAAAGRRAAPKEIEAGPDELVIRYPGPAFRVSYGRIPFLAALLDFCITGLGFAEVDENISTFLSGSKDREAFQSFANTLSRMLYEFLKPHLPTQQYERKFSAMCGFVAERTGRRVTADEIDDRTVLAFWEACCSDSQGAGDFRGFRTVAVNFLHLRVALRTAAERLAIDAAAPIGSLRDAGEVDPADICSVLEVVDGRRSVLAELAQPPAERLKTLNKREGTRLELVMEAGDAAVVLPLTILRAECFGAHQARIIQAIRKRQVAEDRAAIDSMIEQRPAEDYNLVMGEFTELTERLRKVRQALMFILFRNALPEAFEIGFDLFPDAAEALRSRISEPEASYSENVIPLRPGGAIGRLLQGAVEGDPVTMPEADLFRQARLAFAKVNRRGFDESRVCEPEIRDAARASEPLLRACGEDLRGFLRALERHFSLIPSDQMFDEDCRRFKTALTALYRESA